MKIAITGGTGDIGGAFLRFAAGKYPVQALIRKGKEIYNLSENAKLQTFVHTDGNLYELNLLKNFTNADAVVHFAAVLNTKEPTLVDYIAINGLLTSLLVHTNQQNKRPAKFVYISSEMVYQLANDKKLARLAQAFVQFCQKAFIGEIKPTFDLKENAKQFISEQKDFPFSSYNPYALTKYLGEIIALTVSNAAVVRITNAYGPGYDNLRLIPKLIVNRLTGHTTTYIKEKRDFVYNADIHHVIDLVIDNNITGTIDCKSGEVIDTDFLKDSIVHLTPTAYGQIQRIASVKKYIPASPIAASENNLVSLLGQATTFHAGLLKTVRYHKEMCYHEMKDLRTINEFINHGEKLIKKLHGSSSAYIFAVEDAAGKKVRKVAIRDGVEGNGIAKVKNEIRYYQYISKNHKRLAKLYPQLLDFQTEEAFSLETIEYLDGYNFYETLQKGNVSELVVMQSMQSFIDKICLSIFDTFHNTPDDQDSLDVYYLERALDRLGPMRKIIPITDSITINGTSFLSPHVILNDLLENKQLRKFITPQVQSFCFHGDMTLLNTVYLGSTNQIKLIDPRGYTGQWDPLYDFGKIKMTLDGFGELILGKKQIVTKDGDGFRIDFDQIPPSAIALRDNLFRILEQSKKFSEEIIAREPYWKYRISLAAATHFLADIPFRLFTDDSEWPGIGAYILGTYYLNDIYSTLKKEIEK